MGQKINSIPKEIKNNLYFQSDEEAIRTLQSEARVLKYIALKAWRRYLNSYSPKRYVRTRSSQNSIKIGKVRKLGENEWGIDVYFQDDLAYHDSVVGKNQPKGHAIYLLSVGWEAKKLEQKIGIRKNFTRHEGTGYLLEVSKLYNAKRHKGISLEIQWNGK